MAGAEAVARHDGRDLGRSAASRGEIGRIGEEERERGTNCGSDEALKGLQNFISDLLGGRVEGVRFSLPLLVGRGDVISKKHAAGEKSNRSKTEDWRVKEGI